MNLSVAIGMDQDAVLYGICAAQRFVHDVVIMPPRDLRDGLGADGADASLFFPEVQEPTFSVQGLFHLYAEAFFKVDFPGRIVGVTVPFDLGVLFVDGRCGGQAQPVLDGFSIFVFCRTEEAPVLVPHPPKVAVFYPSLALLWVSPPCPSPQSFEDGHVNMDKGFLGRGVSVKVRPSPYFRVECRYQPVCRSLFVFLDDVSDVRKEHFDVLLRRGDKESQIPPRCALSWFSLPRVPSLVVGESPSRGV